MKIKTSQHRINKNISIVIQEEVVGEFDDVFTYIVGGLITMPFSTVKVWHGTWYPIIRETECSFLYRDLPHVLWNLNNHKDKSKALRELYDYLTDNIWLSPEEIENIITIPPESLLDHNIVDISPTYDAEKIFYHFGLHDTSVPLF